MKKKGISIPVCAAVLLIFWNCSSFETRSAGGHGEPVTTPIPSNIATQVRNIATFNDVDGWPIPVPMERELTKVSRTNDIAADGRPVEVVASFYSPKEDFFFSMPSDPSSPESKNAIRLKLQVLGELAANGHVFGYTIFAAHSAFDQNTGKEGRVGNMFVYRCYDNDGDGKFETMITDDSAFRVPEWTMK